AGATPWRAGPHAAGRPRCTAATAARRRRSRHDRPARPLALPDLALQREGALGARLEGHPARAPRARAELHAAGAVGDRAGEAARPVPRRAGDRRLDAHHRGAQPGPRPPAFRQPAINELGFLGSSLRHNDTVSLLGPSDTFFSRPDPPWVVFHIDPNRSWGVGSFTGD